MEFKEIRSTTTKFISDNQRIKHVLHFHTWVAASSIIKMMFFAINDIRNTIYVAQDAQDSEYSVKKLGVERDFDVYALNSCSEITKVG